jgi:hypothetical protein
VRLERWLDEFAGLGIHLAPPATVRDLLVYRDWQEFESDPMALLLHLAGDWEHPQCGWLPLSNQVDCFDYEGYVNSGDYVELLARLCRLAGRPERVAHPADVVISGADGDIGVGWLEYDLDGTRRHHDLYFKDDWADLDAVRAVMSDLEEDGRRFWGVEQGQGPLAVYLDDERAGRLAEMTGSRNRLEPLTRPPGPAPAPPVLPPPVLVFDPRVQPFAVDGLPELGWRQVEVMADACAVIARTADGTDPDDPRWEIVVSAHRGRQLTDGPLLPSPGYEQRLVPAPPVRGGEAYWLEVLRDRYKNPHRTRPETVLRWPDDPGYFQVSVYGPATGAREVALRVAEGVRPGAAAPVRLPFTLGPLPGGLFPQFIRVGHGAGDRPWEVELRCAHEPLCGRPSGLPRGVEIRCYPSTAESTRYEIPDREVDGHPALFRQGTRTSGDRYESLAVFDVDGHYLRIQALGDRDCDALGPAGVLGLFRTLSLTPDDWTATPFT